MKHKVKEGSSRKVLGWTKTIVNQGLGAPKFDCRRGAGVTCLTLLCLTYSTVFDKKKSVSFELLIVLV